MYNVSHIEDMGMVVTQRSVVVPEVKSVVDLAIAIAVIGLAVTDTHDLTPGVVRNEGNWTALFLPAHHHGVVVGIAAMGIHVQRLVIVQVWPELGEISPISAYIAAIFG